MSHSIKIQGLTVRNSGNGKEILHVDKLELDTEILTGIYGDSGGGKSTLINTINGLNVADKNLTIEGSIEYNLPNYNRIINFQQLPNDFPSDFRGKHVFTINQYLNSGFSPVHRVGIQLSEMYSAVRKTAKSIIKEEILFWVSKVGIDQALLNRFPSQLSGGEIQRLHLVLAFALNMDFLLCDEMSSALDEYHTEEIFKLIKEVSATQGIGAIMVSHEVYYLKTYCDKLICISEGKIVQSSNVNTHRITSTYSPSYRLDTHQPILECKDLTMSFSHQVDRRINVIENLNLILSKGTITCISGKSGVGKSTLGKLLAGLITPDSGVVLYKNRDLQELNSEEQKSFMLNVQYVYQDALMSLNPAKKLKEILRINTQEALKQGIDTNDDMLNELMRLFELAGLPGGRDTVDLNSYPHHLSGGQVQRFQLLIALLFQPQILILDEPFSALDQAMRKKLMMMLIELKKSRQLCCLIITHQMDVVQEGVDFIWNMQNGKLHNDKQSQFDELI